MMLKTFALSLGILAAAGPALAQTAATAAELCDKGQVVTVRFNELIPGGTFDGFKAAASANQKFYRDRGINGNVQLVGRAMVRDAKTGTWSFSPNGVSTAHINSPMVRVDSNDPAWKAFVAQYDANSKVTAVQTLCYMPAIDETATIMSEIKRLEQVWVDKALSGDAAGLGAILDDSYMSYGKSKPETKADLLASTADPKKKPKAVSISDVTVRVEDDLAFAQGVWTETDSAGKVIRLSFLDIWKQDRRGAWKAIVSQVGPVGP